MTNTGPRTHTNENHSERVNVNTHDESRVPSASSTEAKAALVARHRRVIERYFEEVWNQGNVDVLDELLTADYVNHSPSTPNPPVGPSGLVPIVLAMRRGIPDLRYRIDELIVTEEAAAVRLFVVGTHRGELFGMAPTNRSFAVAQMNFERFRDGRIAEHHRLTDELGMLRHLGLMT